MTDAPEKTKDRFTGVIMDASKSALADVQSIAALETSDDPALLAEIKAIVDGIDIRNTDTITNIGNDVMREFIDESIRQGSTRLHETLFAELQKKRESLTKEYSESGTSLVDKLKGIFGAKSKDDAQRLSSLFGQIPALNDLIERIDSASGRYEADLAEQIERQKVNQEMLKGALRGYEIGLRALRQRLQQAKEVDLPAAAEAAQANESFAALTMLGDVQSAVQLMEFKIGQLTEGQVMARNSYLTKATHIAAAKLEAERVEDLKKGGLDMIKISLADFMRAQQLSSTTRAQNNITDELRRQAEVTARLAGEAKQGVVNDKQAILQRINEIADKLSQQFSDLTQLRASVLSEIAEIAKQAKMEEAKRVLSSSAIDDVALGLSEKGLGTVEMIKPFLAKLAAEEARELRTPDAQPITFRYILESIRGVMMSELDQDRFDSLAKLRALIRTQPQFFDRRMSKYATRALSAAALSPAGFGGAVVTGSTATVDQNGRMFQHAALRTLADLVTAKEKKVSGPNFAVMAMPGFSDNALTGLLNDEQPQAIREAATEFFSAVLKASPGRFAGHDELRAKVETMAKGFAVKTATDDEDTFRPAPARKRTSNYGGPK